MDWLERLKATEPGDERNAVVAELSECSYVTQLVRSAFYISRARMRTLVDDIVQDILLGLLTISRDDIALHQRFDKLVWFLCSLSVSKYSNEYNDSRWLGKHIVLNDCQKQLQQSLGDEDQIEIGVDTLDADVPHKRGELALPKMLWLGLLMVEGRHGGDVTIRELPGKRYHRTPCNEHLEFAKVGGGFKLSKRAEFGQFGHSKKSCWLFGLALFDTNDKANDKVPEMVLPFETTPRLYTNKALILKPHKVVFSGERVQTPYGDTYQF
jgi:hypothetical protein